MEVVAWVTITVWLLGNLARATYVGSSDYVWPYSYNECDPKKQRAQEINACQKVHHFGMEPGLGRGAPEIDVIEAMQGNKEKLPNTNITRPYQSCSLQVRIGRNIRNCGSSFSKTFFFLGGTWI